MGKILPISPKLYFTPNTLGCYGLRLRVRWGTICIYYIVQKRTKKCKNSRSLETIKDLFT